MDKYKCGRCGKGFPTPQHLGAHASHYKRYGTGCAAKPAGGRGKGTGKKTWDNSCPICGVGEEEFASRNSFTQHCRAHVAGNIKNQNPGGQPKEQKVQVHVPGKAIEIPISLKITVTVQTNEA